MKYPNALNGLKKIYSAEILNLIVGILMLVMSVFGLMAFDESLPKEQAEQYVLITGILLTASFIIMAIAYIMTFVGVKKAAKDEPVFKNAFTWILVGLVLSLGTSILSNFVSVEKFERYINLGNRLASILVTVYIIIGVTTLAERIGDHEQVRRGSRLQNIIIFEYAISAVLELLSKFESQKVPETIMEICGVVAAVLMVIAYFTFLKLLSRARKMLEK